MVGLSAKDLEKTEAAATTTAYTSYMLNVSQLGEVENVIAAVLGVIILMGWNWQRFQACWIMSFTVTGCKCIRQLSLQNSPKIVSVN